MAVIGWRPDDDAVDSVRTSDAQGMELAVQHLTELGHRQIMHIDGGGGPISDSRRDAYLEAMARRDIGDMTRVVPGGDSQLAGQAAAHRILAMGTLPTAIIAYNDDVAVAASGVLQQHGLHVPGDVAIVGWDNSEAALLSGVGLTTVSQQPEELAGRAFQRIMDRLDGVPVESFDIVLEPSLIKRSSTMGRPHVGVRV
jgi:DNA-binding LacI/PurR family transcriptional regulator